MMPTKKKAKRTKLGLELEGAFKEMAAHLRGEIQLPSYVDAGAEPAARVIVTQSRSTLDQFDSTGAMRSMIRRSP
jgi:hypothetical protein